MAEIAQFISADKGFNAEVIAVLSAAYDRATGELHDRGHARVAREIMARRILGGEAGAFRDFGCTAYVPRQSMRD